MSGREITPESGHSLVQVRIGNRVYDARHDHRCKICTSPARMEIERRLVENWSYPRIEREYSGLEYTVNGKSAVIPTFTWQSARNHFLKGHMPMGAEMQRRIAEKRAEEIGASFEQAGDRFVDHVSAAQSILARGYERLVAGEIEPDLKDTMAAAKFLKEVDEAAQGTLDSEAWSQAMTIYFETAQSIMPPEMWGRFTALLSADPILASLARKIQGEPEDPNVIEAEYTEETA